LAWRVSQKIIRETAATFMSPAAPARSDLQEWPATEDEAPLPATDESESVL
jgi:hypothetical protein